MRVLQEGHLLFGPNGLEVHGWTFDMEGWPYPTPQQQVACALRHIAGKYGAADLLTVDGESSFPLHVERMANGAIRAARAPADTGAPRMICGRRASADKRPSAP